MALLHAEIKRWASSTSTDAVSPIRSGTNHRIPPIRSVLVAESGVVPIQFRFPPASSVGFDLCPRGVSRLRDPLLAQSPRCRRPPLSRACRQECRVQQQPIRRSAPAARWPLGARAVRRPRPIAAILPGCRYTLPKRRSQPTPQWVNPVRRCDGRTRITEIVPIPTNSHALVREIPVGCRIHLPQSRPVRTNPRDHHPLCCAPLGGCGRR